MCAAIAHWNTVYVEREFEDEDESELPDYRISVVI